MGSKHILIVDHDTETRQNVTFLLRLAGHRVTAVRDTDEAINWIANHLRAQKPFDSLLLNHSMSPSELRKLKAELDRIQGSLPILIVDRGAGSDISETLEEEGFQRCRPEDVLLSI